MRNVNKTVLQGSDLSDQIGDQIDANQIISGSFHFFFGDITVDGTVKIQGSNDLYPGYIQASTFVVTNWVDIPNCDAPVVNGESIIIPIAQMAYRWVRPVFLRTGGGSSTVTCNMNAMGV